MTCVVAIKQDGVVYMGADSLADSNGHCMLREDPKVFIKGDFIIGFTSSFRMGQLLMQADFPKPRTDFDDVINLTEKQIDFQYMIGPFVDCVQELFRDKKYAVVENAAESGGNFIVGYKGEIYEIESDYQVGIPSCGYTAVGSGFAYALGALHAIDSIGYSPDIEIKMALSAASAFNSYVKPPFRILSK